MRDATPLTTRQREVLALVGRGLTNKEIGSELGLSEDGVKAHISHLLLRFDVANRVELLNATRSWPADDEVTYASIADESGRVARAGVVNGADMGQLRDAGRRMLARFSRIDSARVGLSGGASPSVVRAVEDLRRALQEMSVAIELARDLPPGTASGRVLDSVRRRLKVAVDASESLGAAIARADRPRARR